MQTRTQAKNRVLKVLEDTNIKLSSVVSDPFGVSGRAIMNALIEGVQSPEQMAQFAKGVLRRKIPLLEASLHGSCTPHHIRLMKMHLQTVDLMDEQIRQIKQIISVPGVGEVAARTIIAEIGVDMSRFESDSRLSSWAARSTNSFLGHTFRRQQARIGGKKAAVAVGHKILVIIYHLLHEGTIYDDGRYDRPRQRQEAKRKQRAIRELKTMGFEVTVSKATA